MNLATKTPEAENRKVVWMGTEYSITLPAEASGGRIGIFDGVVPAGEGPPIHIHRNEDEIFHLIDGRYQFYVDGEVFERAAGDSVFLPKGVPHTFRVISDRAGRHVTMLTPGGFERFFLEVSDRNLRIPADMAEIKTLAGRYGVEFTGPPLAAMR